MAPRMFVYLSFYLLFALAFHPQFVRSQSNNATSSDQSQNTTSRFTEEEKCYSLPYGTFGFISHLLTYYSNAMIMAGNRPLMPWIELDGGHSIWNISLAVIKLIFTQTSAIVTMVRCSHAWQYEAVAAMKLILSLSSSLNVIFPHPACYGLYFPGAIAGLAGSRLANTLWNIPDTRKDTIIITVVFLVVPGILGLVALGALLCFLFRSIYEGKMKASWFGLMCGVFVLSIFGALYSDWILAIGGHNLIGYPADGNEMAKALWVLYFVGKRMSMLVM